MLPGLRFFAVTIVLSASLLIFGLGAAALLRASHDEFVTMQSMRSPQPTVFVQTDRTQTNLSLLRVEPSLRVEPAPRIEPIPEAQVDPLALDSTSAAPSAAIEKSEPEKISLETEKITSEKAAAASESAKSASESAKAAAESAKAATEIARAASEVAKAAYEQAKVAAIDPQGTAETNPVTTANKKPVATVAKRARRVVKRRKIGIRRPVLPAANATGFGLLGQPNGS